jgi:indolepyruvate decarboxylase
LVNATAGSFVEHSPVVVVNGAPTNKEFQNERHAGLVYSHMTMDPLSNIDVFRRITVAAERICNAVEAPAQIDAALTACVSRCQPVYLEVLEDVWRAPCAPPAASIPRETSSKSVSNAAAAVECTVELIRRYEQPVFWAGVEIQRKGLAAEFLRLIETTNIPFTTTVLGKSIVSEDHPLFRGVYSPAVPPESEMKEFIGGAGCLIGIGAWTTGKDTANEDILRANVVLAAHDGVMIGPRYFPAVSLREFIGALAGALHPEKVKIAPYARGRRGLASIAAAEAAEKLTYDSFFRVLDGWLTKDHVVVCDAGFPLIGAQSLRIHQPNGFVAQAAWLAIGYSTPAAIGVKSALPNRRVLVIVGDGAFQETCQALSTQHRSRHDTVVFVLANGIYGIEQKLVNPNPFRSAKESYAEPILNAVYPYNELEDWAYEKLADVIGGQGRRVDNLGELRAVLTEIMAHPDDRYIVNVRLPRTDTPSAVARSLPEVGEDETSNAAWPPRLLF